MPKEFEKPGIVLFTGPSGSGKTHLKEVFRQVLEKYYPEIPLNRKDLDDVDPLIQALMDDLQSVVGQHHTHPADEISFKQQDDGSHKHLVEADQEVPIVPFALADKDGVVFERAMGLHFKAIGNEDFIGLTLADLTGGGNVHEEDNPLSVTDFSYARITNSLRAGQLPPESLDNVVMVVHVERDLEERLKPENIALGRSPDVYKIFGYDDFDAHFLPYLQERGIPVLAFDNEKNGIVDGRVKTELIEQGLMPALGEIGLM
ncbi:hypothetical protein ACFLZ1_01840 [Patescibacteria group bacterium]